MINTMLYTCMIPLIHTIEANIDLTKVGEKVPVI